MKRLIFIITLLTLLSSGAIAQRHLGSGGSRSNKQETTSHKHVQLAPSYAWRILEPMGLREETSIDTLPDNYGQRSVPSAVSPAYVTTGNLGAEGINMIWADRKPMGEFFFRDAMSHWIPSVETMRFYNTRTPMTLLSYNTAGGRDNAQDRLHAIFSGNINAKAQVGALVDYLYSKGSYQNQAAKGLNWGFSGSYLGDRYEFQGFYNHWNHVNKENGGITDPLYITDPAAVQGGVTDVDPKTIPTNLSDAHTRIKGGELVLNNRYKVGYWQEEKDENDSVVKRTYIPVTSFIYNLRYEYGKHHFVDQSKYDMSSFWANTYLNPDITDDNSSYWTLKNTIGVSLLEGFNKYAKFGAATYLTYEINKYTQTTDTIDRVELDSILTPFPAGATIPHKASENLARVGFQITKQKGSILRYAANAELGIVGKAAGDFKADGHIDTRIPIKIDTLNLRAFGGFSNEHSPYFLRNYLSNHFIWQNDFGKERRFKVGGELSIPKTWTTLTAQVENIQNYIYFADNFMPTQHGGSVQVFSAKLQQNLKWRAFNWDNTVIYQTSSNEDVLSLPKLSVYSNMYIKVKIATLFLQFGVDCDYYTKYYSPMYQPATATFANQRKEKVGDYPFMNLYANMKLSKTRFYVMFSHINQGWFSNNYFSMPNYPLNPRRLQIGVSVDFAD